MLRQLIIVLLSALILASCDNNTTLPTQAVQNANPTPVGEATAGQPLSTNEPREYGSEEIVLPMPGTIIAPATEDPGAGQPFAVVILSRIGGFDGKPLDVTLGSDGTVTRDGVVSTVTPDVVSQINSMLNDMSFFGLQGVFQGVGTAPDVYTYDITVERSSGASRTITAQDGYIPPELAALIQVLQQLGGAS